MPTVTYQEERETSKKTQSNKTRKKNSLLHIIRSRKNSRASRRDTPTATAHRQASNLPHIPDLPLRHYQSRPYVNLAATLLLKIVLS